MAGGDWSALCQRCGLDYMASQLYLTWDNLRVCHKCFEYKHPQLNVRAVNDNPSVPWTRPARTTYITGDYVETDFWDVSYTGIT